MKKLTNLKDIRKSRHLTAEQLSQLSGVSAAAIYALETGKNNIENVKLSTLIALSSALKIKVRDLLPVDIAKKI